MRYAVGGARRLVLLSACVLWLAGAPGALGRSKKARKSRGEAAGGGLTWKTWAKEHKERLASDGAADDDAAAETAAFAEEYGCTIDRHSPQTLSEKDFVKDYYLKKPVIITGKSRRLFFCLPCAFSALLLSSFSLTFADVRSLFPLTFADIRSLFPLCFR